MERSPVSARGLPRPKEAELRAAGGPRGLTGASVAVGRGTLALNTTALHLKDDQQSKNTTLLLDSIDEVEKRVAAGNLSAKEEILVQVRDLEKEALRDRIIELELINQSLMRRYGRAREQVAHLKVVAATLSHNLQITLDRQAAYIQHLSERSSNNMTTMDSTEEDETTFDTVTFDSTPSTPRRGPYFASGGPGSGILASASMNNEAALTHQIESALAAAAAIERAKTGGVERKTSPSDTPTGVKKKRMFPSGQGLSTSYGPNSALKAIDEGSPSTTPRATYGVTAPATATPPGNTSPNTIDWRKSGGGSTLVSSTKIAPQLPPRQPKESASVIVPSSKGEKENEADKAEKKKQKKESKKDKKATKKSTIVQQEPGTRLSILVDSEQSPPNSPRDKRSNSGGDLESGSEMEPQKPHRKKTGKEKEKDKEIEKDNGAEHVAILVPREDDVQLEEGLIVTSRVPQASSQQQLRGRAGMRVRVGSVAKLLERLVSVQAPDPEFVATFILTYPSFLSSHTLLDHIQQKFLQKVGKDEAVLRLRVSNVLRIWVEKNGYSFVHKSGLHAKLMDLVNGPMTAAQMVTTVSTVKNIIDRMKSNQAQRVEYIISPKDVADTSLLQQARPEEIAQGLTMIYHQIMQSLLPRDFIFFLSMRRRHSAEGASSRVEKMAKSRLHVFMHVSQMVRQWVHKTLDQCPSDTEASTLFASFVQLAESCRGLGNFFAVFDIITVLQEVSAKRQISTAVSPRRLARAGTDATYAKLAALIVETNDYENYRNAIKTQTPPVIPYFGAWIARLESVRGQPNYFTNDWINFEKNHDVAQVITEALGYQKNSQYTNLNVKQTLRQLLLDVLHIDVSR